MSASPPASPPEFGTRDAGWLDAEELTAVAF
jgi:hypothetical protein